MYVEPMPAQKLVLAMLQPGCLSEKRENHMDNLLQCLKVMNLSGLKKIIPNEWMPSELAYCLQKSIKTLGDRNASQRTVLPDPHYLNWQAAMDVLTHWM